MFDQRESRPFLPVRDPDIDKAPGQVDGHVDILQLFRLPTVTEPVDVFAERETIGGGRIRLDGDRQAVVALPGDAEGDDALSFERRRLEPEFPFYRREVQEVEPAGVPLDKESAGTDDIRAFPDVQEHGGELFPEGDARVRHVAGCIDLPGPGIEGIGLESRWNAHVTALRKGFPVTGAGRYGQHPFLDGFGPRGAGLFDADPVPEQPVVPPAQQFRFAGRVGVGKGDLQVAGTWTAVFFDRAGRAGRQDDQAGGNEQSVHGSGGFSNVVSRGPVVRGRAEGDVDGAGLVLLRVQGSQLPDDGFLDEVGPVALGYRECDGVVVRLRTDLRFQDQPRHTSFPCPGPGVSGRRPGIRIEIEDMFLRVGTAGRDGDVESGLGQEFVHTRVRLEAHPVVPGSGAVIEVHDVTVASIAGKPIAVGQIDSFQTEREGGEGRAVELDGYLLDPGLANQPVHVDPLHAPVRDWHGDGPAAGHHQPPGGVFTEAAFRLVERIGVGETVRVEVGGGIDHGEGRVVARL